ncbi:hypothetical protein [Oceanospirillum linum]|nr:hypothetical protein [Oceanospirillum linum]
MGSVKSSALVLKLNFDPVETDTHFKAVWVLFYALGAISYVVRFSPYAFL